MNELNKGDKALDFCLPAVGEKKFCLKDFSGDFLIIYFYPRDNTPGCTTEAKEFSDLLEKFKDFNAEIIGISCDSLKSHEKFINKHNIKIKLLSDPEHKVIEKYGCWQKKKMAGREYFGIVRSTFLVNSKFEIIDSWKKVKAKGHAQKVLDKIKEIK